MEGVQKGKRDSTQLTQIDEATKAGTQLKRSFGPALFYHQGYGDSLSAGFGPAKVDSLSLSPWASQRTHGPSPMEVANAIAMAKQASGNVLIAQQQVQAARENVLQQQKLASEKEAHAAILTQKSEAAAAIQRSEAASAAQAVILAQQRLAAAKNMVAQLQRSAAVKESQAAAALHSSAHAAAVEIHRTEQEAARLAVNQRTDTAAAAHHVAATKDAILGPLHAGNNHVPNIQLPLHQHDNHQLSAAAPLLPWNAYTAPLAIAVGNNNDWPNFPQSYAPQVKSPYNVWG